MGAWIYTTDKRCPCCLLGDTLILGDNKDIASINVGNQVLSEHGHTHVTNTFKHNYQGQILHIKACGLLPFVCTPEHPLLSVRSKNSPRKVSFSSLVWKEAKDLHIKKGMIDGDYLVLPRMEGEYGIQTLNIEPFVKNAQYCHRHAPFDLPLTKEVAWLLGLYVAEGWYSKDSMLFGLGNNDHESKLIERLSFVVRTIGHKIKVGKTRDGERTIAINTRLLARAFKQWCGQGAENKHIPEFILLHNDTNILKAFLDGYMEGDGYKYQKASTISKILALNLQMIFARLGRFASIHTPKLPIKQRVQGRSVNYHQDYVISIHGNRRSRAKIQEHYIYVPIRKINIEMYNGSVYNIETTHSTFLVNNIISHNCSSLLRLRPKMRRHKKEFRESILKDPKLEEEWKLEQAQREIQNGTL